MTTDYSSIERENILDYGRKIGQTGELFFSDLYSDRTHFIYELLQNTEDALFRRSQAVSSNNLSRTVTFRLYKDRLEVSHHGIPFSEADVLGICGILRGTKSEDLTQIGKFGIGFKSVYAYTSTPHIHSGNEHFCIRDFVKPQAISAGEIDSGETLFILPFDRIEVPAGTAFQEIADRLNGLSLRILLFLQQIERISWEIEGSEHRTYLRESQSLSTTARKVILSGSKSTNDNREEWIVFQRLTPTGEGKDLPVEIAFLLQQKQDVPSPSVKQLIDPTLVVFFPTEKETHVGFLIQGPYRTTLSRDNIPLDDSWNAKLVSETAILLADSLITLRDMGLLNNDLLEALPIRKDNFPETFMFRPLFQSTREIFRGADLLPAADGSHRPAHRLKLARPFGLRDLLTNRQLTKLYEADESLDWLHEDLSSDRNSSVYAYLTGELEIEVVTPSDVAQLLNQGFLESQSDEWIIRFYQFLQDQAALWREGTQWTQPGPLRSTPIIRLEDGRHTAPFTSTNHPLAYLPGEHKSSFPTVRRIIADDKKAHEFLSKLGLRKPDTTAEVLEHVIPKYKKPARWEQGSEALKQDLVLIVEALRTDSSKARDKLKERLQATYFVPALNPVTGDHLLTEPTRAYFQTIELTSYFAGSRSVYFVQQVFHEKLNEEFNALLKSLGATNMPRQIPIETNLSPARRKALRDGRRVSHSEVINDFDLDGLSEFLESLQKASVDLAARNSVILWNFLRTHENEDYWFRGDYSWFFYCQYSADFPSKFLRRLQNGAWLPGQSGKLHTPAELLLSELPADFPRSRPLADVLGMKSDKMAEIAAQLNVDEEALIFLREHADEWNQFVKQRRKQTPEDIREVDVAARTDKSNGVPASLPAARSAADPNIVGSHDESAEGTGEHESRDADSADPKEGSKRLPIFVATGETQGGEPHASTGPNLEIDRAGIKRVLQYEAEHGRQPEEMPHANKGFDIKSWDPTKQITRIIEVKSLSGAWSDANVALSAPQFGHGMKTEQGQEFWLYVVEHADAESAALYCIPNPSQAVTHFVYPEAWKRLRADQ